MRRRNRTQHLTAREVCNPAWRGWPITVTDRRDRTQITDTLADYLLDEKRGHVWLTFVNDGEAELRAEDTVTFDGLGLMGGAS